MNHPAAVMVPPQPGQPGGVGSDHFRGVIRQQVVKPQLHFGHVQKLGLCQLPVGLPVLFQLGKEHVMGLGGAHQLHELCFRSGGEFRILHHIAQGRAHIKEYGINFIVHSDSSQCYFL